MRLPEPFGFVVFLANCFGLVPMTLGLELCSLYFELSLNSCNLIHLSQGARRSSVQWGGNR